MTEPGIDRWASRDLPFLRYVVPQMDDHPHTFVDIEDIVSATGMSVRQVEASARALEDAHLIEMQRVGGGGGFVHKISAQARQIVGVWPTEDVAADRLLHAVETMADDGGLDEAERSRWAAVRDAVAKAGRDIVVQIAASTISGEIPHPH